MTDVPYLSAFVRLRNFDLLAEVTFLVDTGADVTVLNPQDSSRLLPPGGRARLRDPIQFGGAGAGLDHYPEHADVYFRHDDGRVEQIAATVYIATPAEANRNLESLLGRDILGNFVMTFDQAGRALTLA